MVKILLWWPPVGPCPSVGCLQAQSSGGCPCPCYLLFIGFGVLESFWSKQFSIGQCFAKYTKKTPSLDLIFQRPFNNFFSVTYFCVTWFSQNYVFKIMFSWKPFRTNKLKEALLGFALYQMFSSTCRIKVITFLSGLLATWKIYYLGIANTEISKPGDKINTLLSTGIQSLIWPAAVCRDF